MQDLFRECFIYRAAKSYGMDKVPLEMFPNDLNFTPPEEYERQGETDMLLKIIRTDGTLGAARATDIGKLIKSGQIVAYQYSNWWIELRRERKIDYKGPERRTITLH